jgi:hypothetical protein
MYVAEGKLFYADGSNEFFLSCMDLSPESGQQGRCLGQIVPTSINGGGQYVFYTDALNGNAIYRMGLSGGEPLKICAESAEHLHVIDSRLFFWNGIKWKYLPIEGGNPKEV